MITLDIISPSGERQRRSFHAMPVSIGRQVGQLRIQDPGVSALHGQLAMIDGVLCYRDLGSTNGSFSPDGSPIESSMTMQTGDRVRLGEHELCLVEFATAQANPVIPSGDPTTQTMIYPPSRAPWSRSPSVGPSAAPSSASPSAPASAEARAPAPIEKPEWETQRAPSQERPHPAPAPVPPQERRAPEGTIFGRLDTDAQLDRTQHFFEAQAPAAPSPSAEPIGLKTEIIPDPLGSAHSPNYTQPVAPPPPRGTPITFQTAEIHHPESSEGAHNLLPATPQGHSANASVFESVASLGKQPLAVLLSGPALLLCGGGVALSLGLSTGFATALLIAASSLLSAIAVWGFLPQSIAACQLLSGEKVTPFANWKRALAMPAKTQGRWIGLLLALWMLSIVVVPVFLCFPFAAPAILLERKGVFAALKRSASLVSWYPVTSMVPLLVLALSLPLSWLALEKIVSLISIHLPTSLAMAASIASICACGILIAISGAFYIVHTFRVYFFHLSVHDPQAPELNPMRRLARLN